MLDFRVFNFETFYLCWIQRPKILYGKYENSLNHISLYWWFSFFYFAFLIWSYWNFFKVSNCMFLVSADRSGKLTIFDCGWAQIVLPPFFISIFCYFPYKLLKLRERKKKFGTRNENFPFSIQNANKNWPTFVDRWYQWIFI